jgi:hypothetical protein
LAWPVRVVRLTADPSENGLWCGEEGLSLSRHPLLQRTKSGFVPRPLPELQKILDDAYGTENRPDARDYIPRLAGIALSLSKGNLPLAMIGSVMLRLPDIAPATFTSKFDPSQPRDEDGRWTEGAGTEAKQTPPIGFEGDQSPSLVDLEAEAADIAERESIEAITPGIIGLIARFAGVLAGPVALAAGLLIPTNRSNIHYGDIPDFPGLTFRSDEGVVTLSRLDAEGNIEDLYHGVPDADGFYHDGKGDIIGRHVGTGVLFDDDYLTELLTKPAKSTEAEPDSTSVTDTTPERDEKEPEPCPPPTPENTNGRSNRSLAYQSQITGLPRGFDVNFNGVRFDGCVNPNIDLQEAKGPMGGFILGRTEDELRRTKFYFNTMGQAERQNFAAEGHRDDWYFADEPLAEFFTTEFKGKFPNIVVHHTDPAIKFAEDFLAPIRNHLDKLTKQAWSIFFKKPSISERGELR